MKSVAYTVVLVAILLQPFAAAAATIDDARAAAEGIRKLPGKRLTLYTDLTGAEIDQLPSVFEQAFSQWCKFFKVKENDQADWHMTGCLMKDKDRFVKSGLLPHDVPPFDHGYSMGHMLWLNEQPSDYYRRHLLLHEGTHGFMNTVLGGCGPPWYMEGMAEYLATHRWHDGQLTLGYMPRNRDEVPQWGRIRLLQDAVANRRALPLKTVIEFARTGRRENEFYAWCWAAATLLDRHPRYRERFRQLFQFVYQSDFNERFYRLFQPDWQDLCEEWQLMIVNLEYGYDVARSAVDFTPGKPFPRLLAGEEQPRLSPRPPAGEGQHQVSPLPLGEGQGVRVAANRGWQNSGLRLEAGEKYQLTAAGRYQVAKDSPLPLSGEGPGVRAAETSKEPKIWWCEPNGVSIRYYRSRPLGILLAAVRPDQPPPGSMSALLRPIVVGLGTTLSPTETGTLFLKINDSAGELDDNAGELKVEVLRK